jgi:hypothetical protein
MWWDSISSMIEREKSREAHVPKVEVLRIQPRPSSSTCSLFDSYSVVDATAQRSVHGEVRGKISEVFVQGCNECK